METKAEYLERLRQFQADQNLQLQYHELLSQIAKQPNRYKDEQTAIEWGSSALVLLFSHEAEAGFLQEHVNPETKQPPSEASIEQIKQFWLHRRKTEGLGHSKTRDPDKHLDLDIHCKAIEHIAAGYNPTSAEYQVLERIARALIYLEIHGYAPEFLAYLDRFETDRQKESEANFRRLFFKRMGRHLPP